MSETERTLHEHLDWHYGADGEGELRRMLSEGADPNETRGPGSETALHVATRRRRAGAVSVLLDHGADIDARNAGGKTAYAHAVRRGFDDVATVLTERGASTDLDPADRLAVAIVNGRLDEARGILAATPDAARTGNPEEDRLLADVAGRNETAPVELLIAAGANLVAPGLDDATPLHQAAWFGQPDNARLLLEAGAPLDHFEATHGMSPLGWVAHGSSCSGGAAERQDRYMELARLFLEAGASLHHPAATGADAYYRTLMAEASPSVGALIREAWESRG